MFTLPSPARPRRRPARRRRCRPQLEQLEARDLPAVTFGPGSSPPAPPDSPANATLAQATPWPLGPSGTAEVPTAVGDSPAGAADVDFYSLTLGGASHVRLQVRGDGSNTSLQSVLTLYGPDPTTAL